MGQGTIREEARERIIAGKKLTKAQATALGRWAFVEWGAMPGQDLAFPEGFTYAGVEMDEFRADRMSDHWSDHCVEPKGSDLENHERVTYEANAAYWKAKNRLS